MCFCVTDSLGPARLPQGMRWGKSCVPAALFLHNSGSLCLSHSKQFRCSPREWGKACSLCCLCFHNMGVERRETPNNPSMHKNRSHTRVSWLLVLILFWLSIFSWGSVSNVIFEAYMSQPVCPDKHCTRQNLEGVGLATFSVFNPYEFLYVQVTRWSNYLMVMFLCTAWAWY